MSRSLKYIFPAGNTSDVCLLQSTTGPDNLILNGHLSNQINSEVSFISQGYSRQISLTSANNLAGVVFTITGTQNGTFVTENINGPNANTVYSVEIYDVITSISVSGAVNAVSVGSGHSGFFPIIGINLERPIINYSLSTATLTAASISTTIYNTFENISQNGSTYLTNTSNNYNVFVIKAANADDQFFLPVANIIVCNSILIEITGAPGTINNSIQMNFIQI